MSSHAEDPYPVLRSADQPYAQRVRSLAKLVPSRQVDLLPEEIRADVAAVRGWMDRANERHRERVAELARALSVYREHLAEKGYQRPPGLMQLQEAFREANRATKRQSATRRDTKTVSRPIRSVLWPV